MVFSSFLFFCVLLSSLLFSAHSFPCSIDPLFLFSTFLAVFFSFLSDFLNCPNLLCVLCFLLWSSFLHPARTNTNTWISNGRRTMPAIMDSSQIDDIATTFAATTPDSSLSTCTWTTRKVGTLDLLFPSRIKFSNRRISSLFLELIIAQYSWLS